MPSLFERMGGTYRREGDYFIPNIELPDTGTAPLGKYGRMRRRYLQEYRPASIPDWPPAGNFMNT